MAQCRHIKVLPIAGPQTAARAIQNRILVGGTGISLSIASKLRPKRRVISRLRRNEKSIGWYFGAATFAISSHNVKHSELIRIRQNPSPLTGSCSWWPAKENGNFTRNSPRRTSNSEQISLGRSRSFKITMAKKIVKMSSVRLRKAATVGSKCRVPVQNSQTATKETSDWQKRYF